MTGRVFVPLQYLTIFADGSVGQFGCAFEEFSLGEVASEARTSASTLLLDVLIEEGRPESQGERLYADRFDPLH